VRLAFAVAAHLEPDILVVDEVLAVGDAEFQKKCLGKMGDVAREGRTVLFVSHNLGAIERLCGHTILLQKGSIAFAGITKQVIETYLHSIESTSSDSLSERKDRRGNGMLKIEEVDFIGSDDRLVSRYRMGEDIVVRVRIRNRYSYDVKARLNLSLRSGMGIKLVSCDSQLLGHHYTLPASTVSEFNCRIISLPLNHGEYDMTVSIRNVDMGDQLEDWIPSARFLSIKGGFFTEHQNTNSFPVLVKFDWTNISRGRKR